MKDKYTSVVLCRLSITQWTANKLDKEISTDLETRYGSSRRAVRANKSLIVPEDIRPVTNLVQQIRAFWRRHTTPYDEDGKRFLAAGKVMEMCDAMRDKLDEFSDAADDFAFSVYPESVKTKSPSFLGGAFRADDYPAPEWVRRKFAASWGIEPLPSGENLVIDGIADEAKAEIREMLDHRVQSALRTSHAEIIRRMLDALADDTNGLIVRIEPGKTFRDSAVERVRELCDFLPELNVLELPEIDAFINEVADNIAAYGPDAVRNDTSVRESVREAAKSAAEKAEELLRSLGAAA